MLSTLKVKYAKPTRMPEGKPGAQRNNRDPNDVAQLAPTAENPMPLRYQMAAQGLPKPVSGD